MTISQEEIVSKTQTVSKGLQALRIEHESILEANKNTSKDDELSEKCSLIEKSLEMIDLGLNEAEVMSQLASHLQAVEAEKQKLRSQVKRLCQVNGT